MILYPSEAETETFNKHLRRAQFNSRQLSSTHHCPERAMCEAVRVSSLSRNRNPRCWRCQKCGPSAKESTANERNQPKRELMWTTVARSQGGGCLSLLQLSSMCWTHPNVAMKLRGWNILLGDLVKFLTVLPVLLGIWNFSVTDSHSWKLLWLSRDFDLALLIWNC